MEGNDEQQMDWLRRWACRQPDDDEPQRGNGAIALRCLATIHAAAGQIQHHDNPAANDPAARMLVLLLCAMTARNRSLYARSCANCSNRFSCPPIPLNPTP
ncbi:hypothetical protein E6C76_14215 [Pseudothauera nasutitermitis]|uniref:Uncharacterized protein n=1 Tax=Pseudothauera nasutitermitis TaxID=2565930 RepID=A0A4S4AUT6_9RHOO|nr:hypothetical protein [Pseudothauera nasutitermitis]THF63739.1 hypothetical protein E6C76_14215 [Pseudothauera nasutitermitis]